MSAAVRSRIAAEAARKAQAGPWWERFAVRPFVTAPRAGFAPALTAAVLLALVALPVVLRDQSGLVVPDGGEPTTRIEMKIIEDGAVQLAWSNGDQGTYTVYKSSDPRGLAGAEVHVVEGNAWVDRAADSSRIVYYRIE